MSVLVLSAVEASVVGRRSMGCLERLRCGGVGVSGCGRRAMSPRGSVMSSGFGVMAMSPPAAVSVPATSVMVALAPASVVVAATAVRWMWRWWHG